MSATVGFDDGAVQRWAKTITVLGRVVVVTAVVATIAALVLVQRLSATYRDGLVVTEASAALVTDSVVPIRALADELSGLAATLADGLAAAESAVDTTATVIADIGDASRSNLAESATAASDVSERLAGTLETIEAFIPGNRNSIAEELRAFSDGLDPVAEQLRTVGDELSTLAVELDESRTTLAELATQVGVIAEAIEALGPSFDALDATATDLREQAAAASARIGLDLFFGRVLIVALGVVFVAIGVIADRFGRAWGLPHPARASTQ